MAYDERLARRIRAALKDARLITEKRMFGGIAFMSRGNMLAGVLESSLMARVGKDAYADSLGRPYARPMDFTGRAMAGYVFVDAAGIRTDAQLGFWLKRCEEFVATLPAKVGK